MKTFVEFLKRFWKLLKERRIRWGEAVFGREGLKEHSDLESEDDVSSQHSSLESLRPIVLGGEKKQVIRVEKLFVIDIKTMAKLILQTTVKR